MHPALLAEIDLLSECDVIRTKRSGPGGQHRNKVETAIVLTHRPTGMSAEASERRSQAENLSVAIDRLRRTLAIGTRTHRPPPDSVSQIWRSRLKGTRLVVNADHVDYPAMLAESLDYLAMLDWNVSLAASTLGTTSSQLVRLWRKEPRAIMLMNQQRERRGLGRLE